MSSRLTWSKLEHNNITSLVNKSYYDNSLVNYHSISSLDQPQLLRIAVIYTLPQLFKGDGFARHFLSATISGWEISNYFNLESGLPLAITGSNGRPIIQGNPRPPAPSARDWEMSEEPMETRRIHTSIPQPSFNCPVSSITCRLPLPEAYRPRHPIGGYPYALFRWLEHSANEELQIQERFNLPVRGGAITQHHKSPDV